MGPSGGGQSRRVWIAGSIGAAILIATTWPQNDPAAARGFSWCVLCRPQPLDGLYNLIGFAPLGAALAAIGLGAIRGTLIGAAFSFAIELLQASFIPGRYGTLDDVLTNAVGCLAGVLLARSHRQWILPTRPVAVALMGLAGLAFLGVMGAPALLLRPEWPVRGLFGQWAPNRPPYPRFTGKVLRFAIEDIQIPNDRVRQADPLRHAANAIGALRAHAEIVTGPTQGSVPVPIATLVSGGNDVVEFSQRRDDLRFGVRLAGDRFGLRPVAVQIGGALPTEGTLVTLDGEINRKFLSARVAGPLAVTDARLDLHVALGWALVSPFRAPLGASQGIASTIWAWCVALPLGYYGAAARRRGLWIAALTVLGVGFGVVPAMAGMSPTPLACWLGAAAGALAGAAVWAFIEKRRR